MIRIALLPLLCAAPAFAQDTGVQKQLIQRQQATDAFNLQLRHSQEMLQTPPGARPNLEARQFSERQRLDKLSEQQLRDVQLGTPQELRPYERQKADIEREPFRDPIIEVPVQPTPKAEAIPPPRDGINLETRRGF